MALRNRTAVKPSFGNKKRSKSFSGVYGEQHPVFDTEDDRKQTKYRKIADEAHHRSPPIDEVLKSGDSEGDESVVDPLEELIDTLPASYKRPPKRTSDTEELLSDAQTSDSDDVPEDSECDVTDADDSGTTSGDDEAAAETVKSDLEDPFVVHFERMLPTDFVERLQRDKSIWKTTEEIWPSAGLVRRTTIQTDIENVKLPSMNIGSGIGKTNLEHLRVKPQVHTGWIKSNRVHLKDDRQSHFTDLQGELFAVMNSYSDLVYCRRTHANGEEIRAAYCLHILNHALKTRSRILQHNCKLTPWTTDVPDEYRDQGLARPKTLVVVPFRESALRVVDNLINILLPDGKGDVMNKKRFHDHYGSRDNERPASRGRLPDHDATFAGNIDDNFRLGITVTKRSMRLYTNFYASDIIVASPLGLRMIIGAKGDDAGKRNFDFLASIELLVIDQVDVLLMQNWEHVTHILEHLHLQPKNSRGLNFSRVRPWSLEDGWARHYRQTMCFAGIVTPEINSIFNRFSCNYAGVVRTAASVSGGSIRQVVVQLPQVFHRFQASSAGEEPEARFQHFVTKILPQFARDSITSRTLLFVPSYLDYVRLRNHLRRQEVSFAQICEYTDPGKVAQARYRFVHSLRRHLLYTERVHFFHRYRLKGIRHLLFYQLPVMPHFYSELCNLTLLQGKARHANAGGAADKYLTCTVLFSKYDAHRLAAVVGTDRAAQMAASADKDVSLFVTEET